MKIRHLKKRPRPFHGSHERWINGPVFTIPKETVDAITAWLNGPVFTIPKETVDAITAWRKSFVVL